MGAGAGRSGSYRQPRTRKSAARTGSAAFAAGLGQLKDDDLCADFGALVKIDHIRVGHAETAGGYILADRRRFARAVDAVGGVITIPVNRSRFCLETHLFS